VRGRTARLSAMRFRGGLVFKAHRHCVSLNSRLENNKEEEGEGQDRTSLGDASALERSRFRTKMEQLERF